MWCPVGPSTVYIWLWWMRRLCVGEKRLSYLFGGVWFCLGAGHTCCKKNSIYMRKIRCFNWRHFQKLSKCKVTLYFQSHDSKKAKWKGICNLKNAHRDQTGTNDNFDRLAKENSDWKYKNEVFDVIFVRRTGFVRISNLIEYISIEKP